MNSISLSTFRISHKELFRIMVLRYLARQEDFIQPLYEDLKDRLPGKKISRSHFYATINEMESVGLIVLGFQGDRRKKMVRISGEGEKKLLEYNQIYKDPYFSLRRVAELFIHDLIGGNNRPSVIPLHPQQKKFFSKLINVREVIECIMLKQLMRKEGFPADLLAYIRDKYGWQPGEGYLYEVVRSMEEHGWISGEWESDRRSKRIYQLEERGKQVLPRVEESVLFTMKNIRTFLDAILSVFD